MRKKEYIIPKCPECKKELKAVDEIVYEKYDFNEKTGQYDECVYYLGGEQKIKCTNCNADVTDIFEEGACNYQAKKK